MSTQAQLTANRANSQLSTGPKSEAGRAAVAQNNLRHGLVGAFMILSWENEAEFAQLVASFEAEYTPATETERRLVLGMARHQWLTERAVNLQHLTFDENGLCAAGDRLALYLRYQASHQRAFHRCLNDLLKIRAAKAKAEIGFERQKQLAAAEIRKDEMHRVRVCQIKSRTAPGAFLAMNTAQTASAPAEPASTPAIGFEPQNQPDAAMRPGWEARIAALEVEAEADLQLMRKPFEGFKRDLRKSAA